MGEVFIRIRGEVHYLWGAVDQEGVVLDILVQSRRDAGAAKRFFKQADAPGGIVPLTSNALALRFDTLPPGPDLALRRPELERPQTELFDPPSLVERRLRYRIGEMVATQAVEDEGALRMPCGAGLYHRYNATLKRVMGNRARAEMTLAELEAALGWLERNRLADHVHLLDDDPRYDWTARHRRAAIQCHAVSA